MDTEEFWGPIAKAAAEDFTDLRLSPPLIDHDNDQMHILTGLGMRLLAIVTREAVQRAHDRAHVVIEAARAVAPRNT